LKIIQKYIKKWYENFCPINAIGKKILQTYTFQPISLRIYLKHGGQVSLVLLCCLIRELKGLSMLKKQNVFFLIILSNQLFCAQKKSVYVEGNMKKSPCIFYQLTALSQLLNFFKINASVQQHIRATYTQDYQQRYFSYLFNDFFPLLLHRHKSLIEEFPFNEFCDPQQSNMLYQIVQKIKNEPGFIKEAEHNIPSLLPALFNQLIPMQHYAHVVFGCQENNFDNEYEKTFCEKFLKIHNTSKELKRYVDQIPQSMRNASARIIKD